MDLKKNQRYQATLVLSGLDCIATNSMVAAEFAKAGFADVVVSGSGKQRTATGRWPNNDLVNAPLPKEVTEVKQL